MGVAQATSHGLLECTSELPLEPAHGKKETTTKLANGVMLVKNKSNNPRAWLGGDECRNFL
jgi:hypothetical protein